MPSFCRGYKKGAVIVELVRSFNANAGVYFKVYLRRGQMCLIYSLAYVSFKATYITVKEMCYVTSALHMDSKRFRMDWLVIIYSRTFSRNISVYNTTGEKRTLCQHRIKTIII